MTQPIAVAAGLVADRALGEPPTALHPVAWFGRAMTAVEARLYADRQANGVAHCLVGVGLGAGTGVALRRLCGPGPATAVATAVCVAGRMLDREALAIGERVGAGDLDGARSALRALVGRSPDDLDEAGICRAVIESVAENTVDAVTASVFWALVGGAPAVLAHRAVNTLDAMVGHRNERYERYGWASARLDDAAAWLPARLTTAAVLAPLLRRPGRRRLLATVRHQAAAHPSPNGGLIEAAYAHRLGITLGGTNRYGDRVEERGTLGAGPAPTSADIARAVSLRRRIGTTITIACATAGATTRLRRWRSGAAAG